MTNIKIEIRKYLWNRWLQSVYEQWPSESRNFIWEAFINTF